MLKIMTFVSMLFLASCASTQSKYDSDPRLQSFKETLSCSAANIVIDHRRNSTKLYTDRCVIGNSSLTLGEACDMYTQKRFGSDKYFTHMSQDEAEILTRPLPNGHDVMWRCEGYGWK